MFDKKRYLLLTLETVNKKTFNYQVFFIWTLKFTILIHFYENFNLLFFLPGSKIAFFYLHKEVVILEVALHRCSAIQVF